MADGDDENGSTRPGDQRPGGRTERVRRAVFEAALGLMVDEGPLALGMDAIAARSGVHKTTLYRRWRSVDLLVREALENYDEVAIQQRSLPDAGHLRGDLREVARMFGEYLERPITKAVLRMMISEGPKDPQLASWAASFWIGRSGPFEVLIDRAVARGELPADTLAADVAEPLIGPMLLRTLITGFALDEEFLEGLADLVFHGLRARMEKP